MINWRVVIPNGWENYDSGDTPVILSIALPILFYAILGVFHDELSTDWFDVGVFAITGLGLIAVGLVVITIQTPSVVGVRDACFMMLCEKYDGRLPYGKLEQIMDNADIKYPAGLTTYGLRKFVNSQEIQHRIFLELL